jgi:Tol biopolymer transport system component
MMFNVFGTVLMTLALAVTLAGQDAAREQKLQQAIDLLETKGDVKSAVPLLEEVARSTDQALAARGLLYLGQAQERQGEAAARRTYERIISEFASQTSIVEQARSRLAGLAPAAVATTRAVSRRQLKMPDSIELAGAVSPDGRWVSYVDSRSGNLGIWDVQSGDMKLLTDAPCCDWAQGYTEAAIWSPDGRQLAFAWRGERIGLKVISRDGGPARTLFAGATVSIADTRPGDVTWAHPFGWSPDGKYILAGFGSFVSAGVVGRSSLVLLSVSDGSVKNLKALGRSHPRNAAFSPDGRFIVYDYPPAIDDIRDVFIMAADGTGHRPLVQDPVSHDTALTWVDRQHVLYASDRMGTNDAWMIGVDGGVPVGEPRLVRRAVGDRVTSLGLSASGSLLTEVFLQLSDVVTVRIDPQTGRAATSPVPLPRAQTGTVRGQATWSPDGSRIAYFETPRSSGRAPSLAVQDVRTGGVRLYPLGIQNPERTVWRPDGQAIVFNAAAQEDQGGERLFVVDLVSAAVSTIGQGVQAAFSSDSRYLYYPRSATLIRRDFASGTEDTIYRGPGVGRALQTSPDGRWLATFRSGALIVIPIEGGEPRTIMEKPPNGGRLYNPIAWSADGRHVFAASSQPWTIWRIDIATGEAVNTGITLAGVVNRLSHRANGDLAISVTRGASELWTEPISAWLGAAK